MSLAMWFYPLLLLILSVPSPDSNQGDLRTEGLRIWDMLLDALGLLPWIFSIVNTEASAAWLGFELLSFIMVADLLKSKPAKEFQEAWIKLAFNWLLASVFIGLAAVLSGLFPVSESLLYPLPVALAQSIKPVLAGALFIVGLILKLGLPPLQQGLIDGMEAMDPHRHRRWALTLRLALVYAVWHLAPGIWGALHISVQQFFAICLVVSMIFALLVASVQAGVQRTLSYMGGLLVLPAALGCLGIQPDTGFRPALTWSIWIFMSVGFIQMALLYRQLPVTQGEGEVHTLLWVDVASPARLPTWQRVWNLWWAWSLLFALALMVMSLHRQLWGLSITASILILAVLTVAKFQIGIQLRRIGSPLRV